MAIVSDGILISYSCDKLIKEVKRDIAEFGNIKLVAILEQNSGVKIITDFIFPDDKNDPRCKADPEQGEEQIEMSAKKLLRCLREQNDPVKEFPPRFN